jgi:hypothetical protein
MAWHWASSGPRARGGRGSKAVVGAVVGVVVALWAAWSGNARAEAGPEVGAAVATAGVEAEGRIRDNLFLLEEAYNQEPGVIQHIQVFQFGMRGQDWSYSFTEEWPVPTDRHQLSVTLPVVGIGEGGAYGIGDVLLNYRLQLLGLGGAGPMAIAPRLSLVCPTGDAREGTGRGGWGLQFNLPLSLEAGAAFVVHLNAGATMLFDALAADGATRERVVDANLGAALVWQPIHGFNVLVETVYQNLDAPSGGTRRGELVVNPGLRFAVDHPASGLQIVPGIAFPLRVWPSHDVEVGILAYLSFEHPVW